MLNFDPPTGPPAIDDNDPGAPTDPDPAPGRCRNCGGAHHIQACPDIVSAFPNPGRAISRQWSRDTLRFRSVLIQLDPLAWPLLAAPCARYREMTTADVLDRWERLVRGTNLPARVREAA